MIIIKAIENIGEKFFKKSFDNIRDEVEQEIIKDSKTSFQYLKYLSKIGQMPLFKNLTKLIKSAEDYSKEIPPEYQEYYSKEISMGDMIEFIGNDPRSQKQFEGIQYFHPVLFREIGNDPRSQKQFEEEFFQELENKERKQEDGFIINDDKDLTPIFEKSKLFMFQKISEDDMKEFIEYIALAIASRISSVKEYSERSNVEEHFISEVNPFIDFKEKDIKSFANFFAGIKDEKRREIVFNEVVKSTSKIVFGAYSYRYFLNFVKEKKPNLFKNFKTEILDLLEYKINFDALAERTNTPRTKLELQRFNKFIKYISDNIVDLDIPKIKEMANKIREATLSEKIESLNKNMIKDTVIELLFISELGLFYEKFLGKINKEYIKSVVLDKIVKKYNLQFAYKDWTQSMAKGENVEYSFDYNNKIWGRLDLSDKNALKSVLRMLVEMILHPDLFSEKEIIELLDRVYKNKINISKNKDILVDKKFISDIALHALGQLGHSGTFADEECSIFLFKNIVERYKKSFSLPRYGQLVSDIYKGVLNSFFRYGKNFERPLPQTLAVLVDYRYSDLKKDIDNFGFHFKKSMGRLDSIIKKLKGFKLIDE